MLLRFSIHIAEYNIGELQFLDAHFDFGEIADDHDGHLAAVQVLVGDPLNVVNRNRFDVLEIAVEIIFRQMIQDNAL